MEHLPNETPGLPEPELAKPLERFHNPEVERIPTPRTEAARSLTRLVALLIPNSIDTDRVEAMHQIDAVAAEFQIVHDPMNIEDRNKFLGSVGSTLLELEEIGLGDYLSTPDLKNYKKFRLRGDGTYSFSSLFTPWQYSNGEVKPTIDIGRLQTAVEKLPESNDNEISIKANAQKHLLDLEQVLQNEESEGIDSMIDKLDAPTREHLDTLEALLNEVTEEEIAEVLSLQSASEAEMNEVRKRIKPTLASAITLITSLCRYTKIGADRDRTLYPEFWQLTEKCQRIFYAHGTLNGDQIKRFYSDKLPRA